MDADGKRYRVNETERALNDLTEILTYLVKCLHNRQAAQKLLREYEKAVETLESLPLGFPLVREQTLSFLGYRWIAVENYAAFYTVDEAQGVVNIERVLHRRRNWARLLAQEHEPHDAA